MDEISRIQSIALATSLHSQCFIHYFENVEKVVDFNDYESNIR